MNHIDNGALIIFAVLLVLCFAAWLQPGFKARRRARDIANDWPPSGEQLRDIRGVFDQDAE